MISSIAWKNIWRNKIRSLIVILAICVGIMAGIFSIAVMKGMMIQRIQTGIDNEFSSIQIHSSLYNENNEITSIIDSADLINKEISVNQDVIGISKRFKVEAMLNSARSSSGGFLIGIDPENEKRVSKIYSCLKDSASNYFEKSATNPIIISQKTAEQLKVKLRNKIEINLVNSLGEPVRQVFKIIGIYKTSNSAFDAMNSFVLNSDMAGILQLPENSAHEIAILVKDNSKANLLSEKLQSKYGYYSITEKVLTKGRNDSVPSTLLNKIYTLNSDKIYSKQDFDKVIENNLGKVDFAKYQENIYSICQSGLVVSDWRKTSPELDLTTEYLDFVLFIFLGIILLALGFGIVNTMLMVVLERTRELGMLISIGMNKRKVFSMIMVETIFLSLTGAATGMLFGWILIEMTLKSGIDLSMFAEGLEAIGYQSVIYPFIEFKDFISTTLLVVTTAIVASLYPAWKAIRLKPAEAVRSE